MTDAEREDTVTRWQQYMYRTAHRYEARDVAFSQHLDDAVQEASIHLWLALTRYNAECAELGSFVIADIRLSIRAFFVGGSWRGSLYRESHDIQHAIDRAAQYTQARASSLVYCDTPDRHQIDPDELLTPCERKYVLAAIDDAESAAKNLGVTVPRVHQRKRQILDKALNRFRQGVTT